MKKIFLTICIVSTLLLATSLKTTAQVVVKIRPVPPKTEVVKPDRPSARHIWIDDHWVWSYKSKSYVWVKGYWGKSQPGKVWIKGHWIKTHEGWKWIPGHWKKFR